MSQVDGDAEEVKADAGTELQNVGWANALFGDPDPSEIPEPEPVETAPEPEPTADTFTEVLNSLGVNAKAAEGSLPQFVPEAGASPIAESRAPTPAPKKRPIDKTPATISTTKVLDAQVPVDVPPPEAPPPPQAPPPFVFDEPAAAPVAAAAPIAVKEVAEEPERSASDFDVDVDLEDHINDEVFEEVEAEAFSALEDGDPTLIPDGAEELLAHAATQAEDIPSADLNLVEGAAQSSLTFAAFDLDAGPSELPAPAPTQGPEMVLDDRGELTPSSLPQRAPTEPAAPMPPPLPKRTTPPPLPALRRARAEVQGPAQGVVLGIDLGTTYTAAAVVEDGETQILPARRGQQSLASVVRYGGDGRALVGDMAERQAAQHPDRTIIGWKRILGRSFASPAVQEVREHFSWDVVPGPDGEAAVRIDNETLALTQVAAEILREVRENASLLLERKVNRAVITCPAHFTERQRDAVRAAGLQAGFHVERVLTEPTAAALSYGERSALDGKKVLVFDLGGGTFDVSILEVHGDVYQVLATGGDAFLGGVDFDACIVEMLVESFLEAEEIDARTDPVALAKLFVEAEKAKRALSENNHTLVEVEHLVVQNYAARRLTVVLHRHRVEEAFRPLVEQCIELSRNTCQKASMTEAEVEEVLLVGGQARSPLVRRLVTEAFGREPLQLVDPEEAVARGAARFGASVDSIAGVVLIDALPLPIGVGLPGGRFQRLLPENSPLPVQKTYRLNTTRDMQTRFELLLFQGESDFVENNEPLGRLCLTGLPRRPKGQVTIEVTMAVDAECVLSVEAIEPETRRKVQARLATRDTPEQIRERLGLTGARMETAPSKKDRPKGVWSWLTRWVRKS